MKDTIKIKFNDLHDPVPKPYYLMKDTIKREK
jgi:hypothetical protein